MPGDSGRPGLVRCVARRGRWRKCRGDRCPAGWGLANPRKAPGDGRVPASAARRRTEQGSPAPCPRLLGVPGGALPAPSLRAAAGQLPPAALHRARRSLTRLVAPRSPAAWALPPDAAARRLPRQPEERPLPPVSGGPRGGRGGGAEALRSPCQDFLGFIPRYFTCLMLFVNAIS